jgi:hypothetical protein
MRIPQCLHNADKILNLHNVMQSPALHRDCRQQPIPKYVRRFSYVGSRHLQLAQAIFFGKNAASEIAQLL